MAGRGITMESITNAAVTLIIERGYDAFSLRELALRLQVKPASIYNHVQGLEQIKTAVAVRAADMLNLALKNAVNGKNQTKAFIDGTNAYREFSQSNSQMYKALIKMPANDDEAVVRAAFTSFEPLRCVVKSYGAQTVYTVHFLRRLRAAMHGFIELSDSGFMQRGSLTMDETYRAMQLAFLRELRAAVAKNSKKQVL